MNMTYGKGFFCAPRRGQEELFLTGASDWLAMEDRNYMLELPSSYHWSHIKLISMNGHGKMDWYNQAVEDWVTAAAGTLSDAKSILSLCDIALQKLIGRGQAAYFLGHLYRAIDDRKSLYVPHLRRYQEDGILRFGWTCISQNVTAGDDDFMVCIVPPPTDFQGEIQFDLS